MTLAGENLVKVMSVGLAEVNFIISKTVPSQVNPTRKEEAHLKRLLVRISYYLAQAVVTHHCTLSATECWFCLSNPNIAYVSSVPTTNE